MIKQLALAACLAIGSSGASAMEYGIRNGSDSTSVVVDLSGYIESGDGDRFAKFIIAHEGEIRGRKRLMFTLNSIGGYTADAFDIAELIAGQRVVVIDRCLSACFYMFMSGGDKYMTKNAVIGVHHHAPVPGANVTLNDFAAVAAMIALQMRAKHVPEDVIVDMVTTSNGSMHVLTADQLSRMGVVAFK